ncbi:FAD-dependent oxidoreductase [Nonomuraea sp. NBC_01738]|uniref:NAD(P)/FAD-dependent oxidoreductase n=1 Tax=Nonomuraea sp. NBC_01738 TaxID=2976003 RepID=UPI002E0EBA3A|nr:FAD-dependent oxidoreductase [Nonomuraea sp. NBC_01738]
MSEQRILVLGGGYTGLLAAIATAKRTREKGTRVTLVNPSPRFTERLRLHQVAAGQELADLRIPDLLRGTGVEFVRGRVREVDASARLVTLDDGRDLGYDTLVYALGGMADTTTVPGVAEHAFTLNSASDARRFAETVRLADTAVVAGGGLTGVEAAAELAESNPGLRVTLISHDEPGSMMGRGARAYLRRTLARLGVEVRAGVRIAKVLPDGVELDGGEWVRSDATLWTTGVRVSPMAARAGLTVDDKGRIVVDATLRSVSHPDVYAVGDAAAVTLSFGVMHGTCQGGIPTAAHAAANITAQVYGKAPKPFRFGYIHQPVSLGRRDAVIQFTRYDDSPRRLFLTGRLAVAYKEFVSSSPWKTFKLLKIYAGALVWPHDRVR